MEGSASREVVLGLPGDCYDHVLLYVEGKGLLTHLVVGKAWKSATESCEAAWRNAQERDYGDVRCVGRGWGPKSYRLSRACREGVFVVELGASGERVGLLRERRRGSDEQGQ